ncbi:MAG: N-acetylglucosamine kinase, partial [Flavitalea sp.]
MILIADGGSTKTSWCAIDTDGKQTYFNTEGYNPYFVEKEYIQQSLLASLPPEIFRDSVKEVFYYGAGCSDDKGKVILQAMKGIFPGSTTEVHLDLLASARAVLGSNPGFAAILGTGTNSCLYDGKKIIMRI